jgi:hypothetical protein
MSWLHELQSHRVACLSCLSLADTEVAAIKGIVIMGRDASCEQEALRRLKAADLGSVSLLTYDDLRQSLTSLISQMKAPSAYAVLRGG